MFRILSIYATHKLFNYSLKSMHLYIFKHVFQGLSIHVYRTVTEEFLNSHIDELLNPKVYPLLKKYQASGFLTGLLSSSPDFIVAAVAKQLGFTLWKATTYDWDSSERFSALGSLLAGKDKADVVRQTIESYEIPFAETYAYSDSYLDEEFLAAVANPVMVNPDPKLLEKGIRMKWETI
jgi:phosphoserine phosphatase